MMAAVEPHSSESRGELEVRRRQALMGRRRCLLARAAAGPPTLVQCHSIHPDFGRLYQERGHCFRAVGETTAAIESYTRATTLNPSLPASWQALAEMCSKVGMSAQAESAARQAAHLAKMPRPVVAAAGMFAEGNIDGAERLVRQFLHTHNDDIEAMRLLAQIGLKLDILDDAEFLLESVRGCAPDYHAARYEYALGV